MILMRPKLFHTTKKWIAIILILKGYHTRIIIIMMIIKTKRQKIKATKKSLVIIVSLKNIIIVSRLFLW